MYGSNLALEDLGLGKELWYGSIVKRVDVVIHVSLASLEASGD
jgi:hypothetical protein